MMMMMMMMMMIAYASADSIHVTQVNHHHHHHHVTQSSHSINAIGPRLISNSSVWPLVLCSTRHKHGAGTECKLSRKTENAVSESAQIDQYSACASAATVEVSKTVARHRWHPNA
jgi:hypothetical protein